MGVLIPRVRTIGVRLSEEEYSALQKFSVERGARSMSDVARTAICKFVRKPVRENSLASAVEHAEHVRDLEQTVSQLTAEIALLRADRAVNTSEHTRDCTELSKRAHGVEMSLVPGSLTSGNIDPLTKKANKRKAKTLTS